MICYPSSKDVTPLIVAGPQRSGTRFVTNVLNSTPGVTLHGEIPLAIMEKFVELARKSNNKYTRDTRDHVSGGWEDTKRDFMYAAWANLTKGRRRNAESGCVFYGYKSPFHEKYFDFYNTFFDPVQPKYVCCVRSFPGHFYSVQARWPQKHISKVALRYVRSLDHIRRIKRKRPDDVLLFFLDDYKVQKFAYLREKIFEPLGLKELAGAEKKAAQGPANASAQLGLEKRDTLSGMQELFLKIYPQPLQKYESLHREFG